MCSLCTTLFVEWEPDLIAISVLYLACHLMKFKVDNWVDKPAGYTGKWYKFFVNDVNLNIIEGELLAVWRGTVSDSRLLTYTCRSAYREAWFVKLWHGLLLEHWSGLTNILYVEPR